MISHPILKSIITLPILLGFSSVILAQEKNTLPPKQKFYLGILVSGSKSSLTQENEIPGPFASVFSRTTQSSVGYKVGLSAEYNISKRLFLLSSLSFVKDVNIQRVETSTTSSDNKMIFSWIEMPLTINYSIVKKESFSIFVGGGGAIRRLTASSLTLTTPAGEFENSMYTNTNEWNTFLTAQTGAQFYLSNGNKLQAIFTVQRSANSLYKPPADNPDLSYITFVPDYRLTTFNLSLQYAFPIHRKSDNR